MKMLKNQDLEGIIMAEKGVESKEKSIHDGVSPIIVPDERDEDKLFQMLWDYLAPLYGKAPTAQGEIIRIAGRVQHEFLNNGCINWDEDFHKMLDAFLQYLRLGNGFNEEDLKTAEILVQILKENGDKGFIEDRLTTVICSCAMTWVKQNPTVIEPLNAEYVR